MINITITIHCIYLKHEYVFMMLSNMNVIKGNILYLKFDLIGAELPWINVIFYVFNVFLFFVQNITFCLILCNDEYTQEDLITTFLCMYPLYESKTMSFLCPTLVAESRNLFHFISCLYNNDNVYDVIGQLESCHVICNTSAVATSSF